MDTVTHVLLGAAVTGLVSSSCAGDRAEHGRRLAVGAIAAAFPDIDYLVFLIDPQAFLTVWHRGVTHSLVMVPVWAAALGWVLARLMHVPQRWVLYGALAAAALVSHIASDLATVYGVQLLAPLSDYRLTLGMTFVIDPVFTLICLLGLLAVKTARYRLGASAVMVLVAYVSLQLVLQEQARKLAAAYAQSSGSVAATVDALPQPFSPTHWKLVVAADGEYHTAYVNLLGWPRWRDLPVPVWLVDLLGPYLPGDALDWRHHEAAPGSEYREAPVAWQQPALAPFRRFAVYAVVHQVQTDAGQRCVWFTDLRYVLPFGTPPFRYGMCADHSGDDWQAYRLRWLASGRQRL